MDKQGADLGTTRGINSTRENSRTIGSEKLQGTDRQQTCHRRSGGRDNRLWRRQRRGGRAADWETRRISEAPHGNW